MPAVLMAVQKPIVVEVIGESWWHNLLGPALLAVAAILAAGLAAYVAIHNHRRQLAHDQTERDRAHARESIRAAAETIAETLDPLSAYEIAVRADDSAAKHAETLQGTGNERAKKEAAEQQLRSAKKVRKARGKVGDLLIKMMADSISLRISVGAESPVFKHYRELSHTFNGRFRACALTTEARVQRESAGEDDQTNRTRDGLNDFQEACEEWAVRQHPSQQSDRFTSRVRRKRS